MICRSLEANPTAHVFACVFGELESGKYKLARQCALSTPNLSLLGFDKAIIGRTLGDWTADAGDDLVLPPSILVRDGDKVTLRLGDFAALGTLLRGLSGGGLSDVAA